VERREESGKGKSILMVTAAGVVGEAGEAFHGQVYVLHALRKESGEGIGGEVWLLQYAQKVCSLFDGAQPVDDNGVQAVHDSGEARLQMGCCVQCRACCLQSLHEEGAFLRGHAQWQGRLEVHLDVSQQEVAYFRVQALGGELAGGNPEDKAAKREKGGGGEEQWQVCVR